MAVKDLLLALVIVLAWGVNFVVIKLGVHDVPPLLLGALRFMMAAVPVLFLPRPKVPLRLMLAYGFAISVGQFAFLFSAIHVGMPAGLASVVLQSQAFFTLILGAVLLRESWRAEQLGGLVLALGGLAMIGASHGLSMPLLGFLLTVCAAACWALGNITNRYIVRAGQVEPFSFVAWASLVPPLPFLVLSGLIEGPQAIGHALANFSMVSLFSVAYLAFVATLLGYGLWSRLMARYSANVVAPFSLLVPVVGLASASIVFDERLLPQQAAGALLLLAGLAINVFGGKVRARWLAGRTA